MDIVRKWVRGIRVRLSDEVVATGVLISKESKGGKTTYHPILWEEEDSNLTFAEHADHLLLGRDVKEAFERAPA